MADLTDEELVRMARKHGMREHKTLTSNGVDFWTTDILTLRAFGEAYAKQSKPRESSELVKRLREAKSMTVGSNYVCLDRSVLNEAAAEIERLTKRLEVMPGSEFPDSPDGIACRDSAIKMQDEEIERLTVENRAHVAIIDRQHSELVDVNAKLKAATKLLKEAESSGFIPGSHDDEKWIRERDAAIDAAKEKDNG